MTIFNDQSNRRYTMAELVGITIAVILLTPIILAILFVLFALLMVFLGYK